MATVELELGPLARLRDEGPVDVPKALNAAAAVLLAEVQAAFRAGGWRGGTPWPARRVPNVAGIVLDLAGGGQPKDRRFKERPVLVDVGRLRGEWFTTTDPEKGTVTLATNVPYAATLHGGGPAGPFPGAARGSAIRGPLFRWLKANPEWKEELGWLFGVARWSYKKLPARPLVEATPPVLEDVKKAVLEARIV